MVYILMLLSQHVLASFSSLNVVKWKNMKLQLTNNGTKGTNLLSEKFPEIGLQWHPEYALFEYTRFRRCALGRRHAEDHKQSLCSEL